MGGYLNFSSTSNFKLIFSRIKNVEFMLKNITLPAVSIDQNEFATPGMNVALPGTKVTYDPVTLVYHLDEDWITWNSLFNWSRSFARGEGFIPEGEDEDPSYATVQLLNNHNKTIGEIVLEGVFPINVEAPTFGFEAPVKQDVELSVTLAIQNFRYIKI